MCLDNISLLEISIRVSHSSILRHEAFSAQFCFPLRRVVAITISMDTAEPAADARFPPSRDSIRAADLLSRAFHFITHLFSRNTVTGAGITSSIILQITIYGIFGHYEHQTFGRRNIIGYRQ